MKKILIMCLLVFSVIEGVKAQSEEMCFEEGSFAETLSKAKKENKLVFLDAYTSWCSACKWMDKTTFKEKRVADFFNSHFVNIKMDMEKGEGIELQKRYPGIIAYPTYFILDAEGQELHRITGGGLPDEFMEKVKQGMNPETCQRALGQKYIAGNRSREFIISYLKALEIGGLQQKSNVIAAQYIRELGTQICDTANWFFFQDYIGDNALSPGFGIILEHKSEFIRNNGDSLVNAKINYAFLSSAQELLWREYTPDSRNTLKRMIKVNRTSDFDMITLILDLAKAKHEGNVKKLIRIAKDKLHPTDQDLRNEYSLFKSIQQVVLENGSIKEKDELKEILETIISSSTDEQTREHFRNLLEKQENH